VLVEAQLAGQVGDVPAGPDAVVPAVVAGDGGPARGRLEKAEQEAERGRLAGAVGAEQPERFAGGDAQVEGLQGAEAAVVLREMLGREQHGVLAWCGHFGPPMHHRCLYERTKISPSATATDASTRSPSGLRASSSNCGDALKTRVSPARLVT